MKTCYKLVFAFGLLFCSQHVFSQKLADKAKVDFIREQYAGINKKLKSYKKIAKTDTVGTTEGNEVLLYYSGDEIKRVTATYYGETGKVRQEYYFFDAKLIFCYLVAYHYNMPISETNGGKITSTAQERIYLNNGKIFLVKKKPAVSEYFSEFPDDPQKEAKRLMSLK